MSNMKALAIATLVAAELKGKWTTRQGHWDMSDASDAYLIGPDGEEIHLSLGAYQRKGRIELGLSLGQELYRHYSSYSDGTIPEITVADAKTPDQIARDIERRLLPPLRELLAKVRQRKQEHDEGEARRAARLAELRELLGPGTDHLTHNGLNELRAGRYGDRVHATVKVSFGASGVEFHIETSSREAADMIAAAVATARTLER